MRPVCAASWWLMSTTVRGASAGPISPTTLTVVRCGRRRRSGRGPKRMSPVLTSARHAEAERVGPVADPI
jgi:hypothetical protein